MSKPKIGIVLGSTRQGRFADKPAAWIKAIADKRDDLAFEVIDLRDYPLPFFDEPRSPAWGTPENPVARAWGAKIDSLDGFLFVTAEYNRSIPAVLKNALDYAYKEWNRKPAAFVGYGGLGGGRAIEQLRQMTIELQMAPTRSGVHITLDPFVKVMQGHADLADFDYLNTAAAATLDELAWWTKALKAARAADGAQAEAA